MKNIIETEELKHMSKKESEGLFSNVSDQELKFLYEQILDGREVGLRSSCFDKYIKEV